MVLVWLLRRLAADWGAGKAPYTSCLRGRVFAPQGFLKLVFEKGTGVIIGVHILGTDACELIHCETSFLFHYLLAVSYILAIICCDHPCFQSLPDDGLHPLVFCPASS